MATLVTLSAMGKGRLSTKTRIPSPIQCLPMITEAISNLLVLTLKPNLNHDKEAEAQPVETSQPPYHLPTEIILHIGFSKMPSTHVKETTFRDTYHKCLFIYTCVGRLCQWALIQMVFSRISLFYNLGSNLSFFFNRSIFIKGDNLRYF